MKSGIHAMDELLGRTWWMLVVRGVAGLLFGLLALALPGLTLQLLIAMFAAYVLIGGIAAVVAGIRHRSSQTDWWVPFLLGLCSIGAGMIAILAPGMTALVLIAVMGANSIVTGAIDLIAAVGLSKRTRKVGRRGDNEWLLFVIGLLSVLFGIVVLVYPDAGALALIWMIGGYVVLTGALLIALGISARGWQHSDFPDKRNRPLHP
jgi:uncharacterized membrane protein HdeD (DUF308 family)